MPSAITAIFGADSTQFVRELSKAEAAIVGTNRRLSSGGGANIGGNTGGIGALGELIVLFRELGRGNTSRIPGSLTILAQRLGLLKFLIKDNASAAAALADGYENLAKSATKAAVAAVKKAEASLASAVDETDDSVAAFNQALADDEAAIAATAHAKAMQAKAIAAREAAAAEETEAVASVGAIGIVAGVVTGILIGLWGAHKIATALVDRLKSLDTPDFHPEYIAKYLQKVNQGVEMQKELNREVDKTIAKYHEAGAAAKRIADATKEQFEHERKMNEYTKDPRAKAAKELDIDRRERQAEIDNKRNEAAALAAESRTKEAKAAQILTTTPSAAADKNTEAALKDRAKKAQEYLDKVNGPHSFGDTALDVYALGLEDFGGLEGGALTAAKQRNEKEARARIKAANDFEDTAHAHAEARKPGEDLHKEAVEAATKSVELQDEVSDLALALPQKNKDEAEELAAKAAADEKGGGYGLNAAQRIGAYAATPPDMTTALDLLKDIAHNTSHMQPNHTAPPGARGPQYGGTPHRRSN